MPTPTPAQAGLTSDIWISLRTDNPANGGLGTLADPFDGNVRPISNTTTSITAISRLDQLVTVTAPGHPFNDGDPVSITGITPVEYTGVFPIKKTGANTFTYVTNTAIVTAPQITGSGGNITEVVVNLFQLTHSFPGDLDILLVGPAPVGAPISCILMSDAGSEPGGSFHNGSITNVNLTFNQAAASSIPGVPQISSGGYKPADYSPGETWPSPAPSSGYGTLLTAFNGTSPAGTWSLYIVDDFTGDSGSLAGGWSLDIKTGGSPTTYSNTAAISIPASGNAAPYPSTISVPSSGASAVKVQYGFDEVMKDITKGSKSNIRINLGPGIFETRGIYDVDTASPVGWQMKSGMALRGSGLQVTTLKLVVAHIADKHYYAIGTGAANTQFVTNSSVTDLTIDANIQGQPRNSTVPFTEFAPVACGAICISGAGTRISRVRAINFGTQVQGTAVLVRRMECNVIVAGRANAAASYPSEVKDCIVEDCVIEQPGENNFDRTNCIVMAAQEPTVGPLVSTHKNCVVQNCYINCQFTNGVSSNLMGVSLVSNTGSTAKLTTRANHGLATGRIVVVNGAWNRVNFSSTLYNGVFKVSGGDSAMIEYAMTNTPTGDELVNDDISYVLVGTVFRGICVDGGVGAIVEGNRIYHCRHGVYLNTAPSTDITIRNNYFYQVSSACIGGANGLRRSGDPLLSFLAADNQFALMSSSAAASSAFVYLPHTPTHGLVVGSPVRVITPFTGSSWDGYYKVTGASSNSTTPGTFDYDQKMMSIGQMTNPVAAIGVWNLVRLVFENNVVELNASDAQGPQLEPIAVNLFSAYPDNYLPTGPATIFLINEAIIRSNVIRLQSGSTDVKPLAIKLSSVKYSIVEDNLIALSAPSPLQSVNAKNGQSAPTASNNRTTAGVAISFSPVSQ